MLHDHGHVLVITNVSSRDQGEYQCLARNDIGQASSSTNVSIIGKHAQCIFCSLYVHCLSCKMMSITILFVNAMRLG